MKKATYEPTRPHAKCACECHELSITVRCCPCHSKGHDDCRCGDTKRCCGEAERPNRPDYPKPPGWEPGDKPAANPLDGATGIDDLRGKFNQAVIDIIRQGGSPKGPRFGPRKNEYLPFLLIRADAGDRGHRALTIPFWESPDVFVAPNLDASIAPATPTTLGGVAKAGVPNTLWAHVWNLGRAPVYNARVEFYWFNPSLGFNQSAAHLIGTTYVDLGSRTSGHAHRIVKCPVSWIPTFVNNGHECLVVRVFEPLTDPLTPNQWDANNDRHVGQRNISVVQASSPAVLELHLSLGCGVPPGPAQLDVQELRPEEVRWLSVLAGKKQHGYKPGRDVKEVIGFTYPTLVRPESNKATLKGIDPASAAKLLHRKLAFDRGCDELEVLFHVYVDGLKSGECKVYRIIQTVEGKLTGGYTVIAIKE
jgi:hypothetical protein